MAFWPINPRKPNSIYYQSLLPTQFLRRLCVGNPGRENKALLYYCSGLWPQELIVQWIRLNWILLCHLGRPVQLGTYYMSHMWQVFSNYIFLLPKQRQTHGTVYINETLFGYRLKVLSRHSTDNPLTASFVCFPRRTDWNLLEQN